MIENPVRSETRRSRSGLSWSSAMAKWVPYARTSSYSMRVRLMVDAQASSLHSQMYGFVGPAARVSFDCWIHSLISRDWVSFRTSCSRQSVTVGQRQASSALRMAEV